MGEALCKRGRVIEGPVLGSLPWLESAQSSR